MREILFRGRRVDNHKWIEGYYAVIGGKSVIIKSQAEDFYSADDNMKKNHGNEVVEVFHETICQYTGRYDWNGKEIWENDVVVVSERFIGTVIWHDDSGAFYISPKEDSEDFLLLSYWIDEENVKVIGDIFHNPDLMEN